MNAAVSTCVEETMDMRRMSLFSVMGLVLSLGGLPACSDDEGDETSEVGNSATGGGTDAGATSPRDAGTSGSTTQAPDAGTTAPRSIVATAVADGRFTTLAKALTDTKLLDTLEGAGPFTVFAPTDAAFQALGQATLSSLTPEQLKTILLYHVVAGRVTSSALESGPVETASGLTAFASVEAGKVTLNGANVTTADVSASNGVIHVIDKVLLPPNLVQAAQLAGSFNTLLAAATKAGLAETLASPTADVTVFAPTDAAFTALPPGTVEALTNAQLADVLKYHVVAGKVLSKDLSAGSVPTLLTGKSVTVSLTGGVKINDASVVVKDVVTTNGVIHVIDKVLLPPG